MPQRCNLTTEVGSWPILVIVEREIPCAAHGHHVGEVERWRQAPGHHVCTMSARRHDSFRTPQRCCGISQVMTQRHLWRCTCLRSLGFCVPLGRRTWAYYRPGLPLAGSPQEAAAQEIEACPAKLLAFHHFEPINMPFDRAGT